MLFEVLTVLSVAVAQQPAPVKATDQVVVTGELPDDKKRVCKQIEEIGSIIPRRDCRTKGEWRSATKQQDRRTQDYVQGKNATASRSKWVSSSEMGE